MLEDLSKDNLWDATLIELSKTKLNREITYPKYGWK